MASGGRQPGHERSSGPTACRGEPHDQLRQCARGNAGGAGEDRGATADAAKRPPGRDGRRGERDRQQHLASKSNRAARCSAVRGGQGRQREGGLDERNRHQGGEHQPIREPSAVIEAAQQQTRARDRTQRHRQLDPDSHARIGKVDRPQELRRDYRCRQAGDHSRRTTCGTGPAADRVRRFECPLPLRHLVIASARPEAPPSLCPSIQRAKNTSRLPR